MPNFSTVEVNDKHMKLSVSLMDDGPHEYLKCCFHNADCTFPVAIYFQGTNKELN